ncbi:hypothetical protein OROGR_015584 [Orobanche gracilis]
MNIASRPPTYFQQIFQDKVLEIEYFKAVAPRKEEEPSLPDDWVSAVDGSSDGYILTGCYDGFGRAAGICTHELDGHSGPVTSVCNVMPKGTEELWLTRHMRSDGSIDQIIVTASKDRTLRLWKFGIEESLNQPKKIRAFRILRGHTAAVQSIAAEPSGDRVCSGSWDCSVKLWNINASESGGSLVSLKKRKKNGEDEEPQSEGEAVTTFVGHTQCASSVVWPERGTVYSASWDHSIRRWDVETRKNSLSMYCGKVISCIDIGGESSALIAAGGCDSVIRIWDPRKPASRPPTYSQQIFQIGFFSFTSVASIIDEKAIIQGHFPSCFAAYSQQIFQFTGDVARFMLFRSTYTKRFRKYNRNILSKQPHVAMKMSQFLL